PPAATRPMGSAVIVGSVSQRLTSGQHRVPVRGGPPGTARLPNVHEQPNQAPAAQPSRAAGVFAVLLALPGRSCHLRLWARRSRGPRCAAPTGDRLAVPEISGCPAVAGRAQRACSTV